MKTKTKTRKIQSQNLITGVKTLLRVYFDALLQAWVVASDTEVAPGTFRGRILAAFGSFARAVRYAMRVYKSPQHTLQIEQRRLAIAAA